MKDRWLLIAQRLNAFRVFPRLFIITYMWLVVSSALWFMGLPNPTVSQAGFLSVVIGAGAAWFGLYVNSHATLPPKEEKEENAESK